jgi:hypothetical protein
MGALVGAYWSKQMRSLILISTLLTLPFATAAWSAANRIRLKVGDRKRLPRVRTANGKRELPLSSLPRERCVSRRPPRVLGLGP